MIKLSSSMFPTPDWRKYPYLTVSNGRIIQLDVEHYITEFTPTCFSLTVSALWDWDFSVSKVSLSRRAVLDIAQAVQERKFEHYFPSTMSLEHLVWEGWVLPAVWYRCGDTSRPCGIPLAAPIKAVLDEEVSKENLAWLVRSDYPEEFPAYLRVHWTDEWVATDVSSKLEARLNVILLDKARQDGASDKNIEGIESRA